MSKFTLETINEVENRLDAIKDAVADLQTALSGLDNMAITNAFGLEEWAINLDTLVLDLQADLEEQLEVELGN